MTTIDAAATSHLCKKVMFAALATVLAASLSACGTSSNILGGGDSTATPLAQATTPPAQASSRIAIAPVIGAPEAVAKQITAQLGKELEQKRVVIVNAPSDPADYTLRGYVVAAKEKTGTKVSYIWDLTDPSGKRVNRITGEELAGGGEARDPWASVTPTIMQSISTKTASELSTWLSSQPQSHSSAAIAAAPAATPVAMTAPAAGGAALGNTPPPTTASIGSRDAGGFSAVVPSVSGAPGDGSVSLTSAIQRELSRSGVSLAQQAGPTSYRVEGKVKLGASKDGKQPIQIDWYVKDPQGKQLGTVSQKNEIPEGSLDGNWGKVADAAAAAASQGILKLLPKTTATN